MNNIWKISKVICFFAAIYMLALPVSAHEPGDTITSGWGYTAGIYNNKGQIVMNVCNSSYQGQSAAHINSNALYELCSNDEKKTIVIPSGSTVKLMNVFQIGSNTTIIADGATLVMTEKGKGILNNEPDKTNYNSLKNVRIQGGTWKVNDTSNAYTVMRFCHGSNLTIDGATIIGNYESHEIELIAMKNVVVRNCKLKSKGKIHKDSVEEALQIDVATPRTAPGVAVYGSKYVNGQTCKNIQILNNQIEGSRGVCANIANYSGSKFINKFHDNITIAGNTITGRNAEGCTIYNTRNATVKNNVIKTYSSHKSTAYSVGLNIMIQGKASGNSMKNASIIVKGNKAYGYRQGIQVVTKTSTKYKTVTAKNNKCYASKKSSALFLQSRAAQKIIASKNKSYTR